MARNLWRRLGIGGPRLSRHEVDDELSHHLELRAAELEREGMSREEAEARVKERFGDLEYTRAYCAHRQARRLRRRRLRHAFDDFRRDLGLGLRQILTRPGFTCVVVGTLALGLTANTTVFALVDGVLLRPLPYPEPDRLVRIWGSRTDGSADRSNLSPPDLEDLRAASSATLALSALTPGTAAVRGQGDALIVPVVRVDGQFFDVLGSSPALGRSLEEADAVAGAPDVVVLTHGYWTLQMGGDEDVLGRALDIDGRAHTIVGVMAPVPIPTLADAAQPELVLPLRITPENGRGGRWLRAVARLAPGVTPAEADTEVAGIALRLERAYPDTNRGRGARVESLADATVGDVRRPLLLLQAAVVLVLLIALANVAHLVLVRSLGRTAEMGVRRALGAGRGRLIRQLLAESVPLALAGGACALLLSGWLLHLLQSLSGLGLPRLHESALLSSSAAMVAVVSSLAAAVLFALAPVAVMRSETRPAAAPRRHTGRGFVALETGVALVLVTGAALLLHSFVRLSGEDPGLDVTRTTVVEVNLPASRYPDSESVGAFYRDWLRDLRTSSPIRAAGAVNNLPFLYDSCDGFGLEDRPEPPPGERPCASNQLVTPGFFAAAGIEMVEGREFDDRDGPKSPPAVIVNETFARRFWPDRSAIGRTVTYNGVPRRIVGVSRSLRRLGLDREPPPEMFIPHAQTPWDTQMFVVVRAESDGADAVRQVRASLAELDPAVPIGRVTSLESLVASTVAAERFRTLALGAFGGLALLLATLGVYGVMAHSVSMRTREMGVRLALGARVGGLRARVVRDGLAVAGAGLAAGLVASLALGRVLAGLLYEVRPYDPISLGAALVVLSTVAALASWLAGARVTRVDPLTAIRAES